MDLCSPIASVIPSAHGAVLAVLARTTEPLSGRKVAELSAGRVGARRVHEVLGKLADDGIVLSEHRPPAKLYRLNRDHVAAAGIIALTDMRATLLQRMRDELATWSIAPVAACLFGSAARGDGDAESDIDLLVVGGPGVSFDVERSAWHEQLDRLVEDVWRWSGNACDLLELTLSELGEATARDDRLLHDLRRDAITLAGSDIRSLIRQQVAG